jgi:hypothetical protein
MKPQKQKPHQPKTRSAVAVSAHFATGAGTHGGGKRTRNRRDRQSARRELRDFS